MTTRSKEVAIINISPSSKIIPSKSVVPNSAPNKHNTHKDDHRPVSFLLESEVYQLADAARTMRDGKRNELLILLLFQSCLRISEALGLRLRNKCQVEDKYLLTVEHGKGDKPRIVAIPERLYLRMGNYASENGLSSPDDLFFGISRVRAWQILQVAAQKSGLDYKRVYPHLMRHTGSLARLKRTGNIRSLQEHLGHSDAKMTQRYLKTMQSIESLEIESKVEFER